MPWLLIQYLTFSYVKIIFFKHGDSFATIVSLLLARPVVLKGDDRAHWGSLEDV